MIEPNSGAGPAMPASYASSSGMPPQKPFEEMLLEHGSSFCGTGCSAVEEIGQHSGETLPDGETSLTLAQLSGRTTSQASGAIVAAASDVGEARAWPIGASHNARTQDEDTAMREEVLAFGAVGIIDPRAVPISGGHALAWDSSDRVAIQSGSLTEVQAIAASTAHRVDAVTDIPVALAGAEATRRSAELVHLSANMGASSKLMLFETRQAGIAAQMQLEEPARASGVSKGREASRPASAFKRQAVEQPSADVRIDLAESGQGLFIGIAMPLFDAETAPRLNRRIEEVLATYEGMTARVTINGNALPRVQARGGAGHGSQRN